MKGIKGTLTQIATAFLAGLLVHIGSFSYAWPSYTIKLLQSDASPLGYKITPYESSLVGSIIMLGSVPSVLVVGFLIKKIGVKRTEILCGLGQTLAWSIIATAKSAAQIIIGRFIIGLFIGTHFVTSLMYMSEISTIHLRGTVIVILTFMYNIGTLVSYIEGWCCSYDFINYYCLISAVVYTLVMLFMKDAPGHLLRKGKEKEALNSLKFYRGVSKTNQEVLDEFMYMKSQQNENSVNNDINLLKLDLEKEKLNTENKTAHQIIELSPWTILRTSKSTRRVLVIVTVQTLLAVFMGMIVIQSYAGQFFLQAAPSLSPDFCSVLLAIVVVVVTGLSVVVTDLIPRRMLMMVTGVLASSCLALMASMLRWSWAPEWGIPLVMVFYCIGYHMGVINLPFVQLAECLSPQMKSFGTAIMAAFMFTANFLLLLVSHYLIEFMGRDGLFFLFSLIGIVNIIVSFYFMKETRMVPFEEIQKMFEQGYLYQR